MKHLFIVLAALILVSGCGKTNVSTDGSGAHADARPDVEQTKTCIVEFLGQCGMQNIQVTKIADAELPKDAKTASTSWGYNFTAEYKTIIGETVTKENWVAVLAKEEGKLIVRSMWDDSQKVVAGSNNLIDQPNLDILPPSRSTLPRNSAGKVDLSDKPNTDILPPGSPN